jgi:hypothetical protein
MGAYRRWLYAAFAVGTVLIILVVVVGGGLGRTHRQRTVPEGQPQPSVDPIRADEIQTVLSVDAIPAILHPQLVPPAKAALRPDETVIGIVLGSEAHAYPVANLSVHEIANDRVGGRPIAVTW